ncbi:MAG: DUF2953 domain-containing protein [Lachnospiraceae bacterium]|nr:DUF2953 domain-containing protein [Lachnospiraceae bacterium]
MHLILDIILILLQAIGWTLLAVLGLVLLILLIVLLVPIRYRADLSKREELNADARVTWLLRLVRLKVSYHQKLSIELRIGPVLFYSNDEEWQKKKSEWTEAKQKKKEAREAKSGSKEQEAKLRDPAEAGQAVDSGGSPSAAEVREQTSAPEAQGKTPQTEPNTAPDQRKAASAEEESKNESEEEAGSEEIGSEEAVETPLTGKSRSGDTLREKLSALRHKIGAGIEAIKRIPDKIRGIFETIAETLKKGRGGIEEGKRKYRLIKKFLTNEVHKAAIGHTWRLLKKILRHLLPYKMWGTLTLGTGDPCSTGQMLGVLSLMYAKSGNQFTIIPDFEEKRYEGEVGLKGRIRLGTLLILIIRIILNKGVRRLIRNAKRLSSALRGKQQDAAKDQKAA